MKFYRGFQRLKTIPAALWILLAAHPHTFANSLVACAYVPEQRSLIVTPKQAADRTGNEQATEVAVIEIDNNLPEYELEFEFSEANGGGHEVSEVRLEGIDGILGHGLRAPDESALEPGRSSGRFLWKPGPQETATIGYRMKVIVTYKRSFAKPTGPEADAPRLIVSMPSAY